MNRHPSRSGGWRVAGLALLLAAAPALAAGDCPRIISQSPYISHTLAWLELDHCIVGASRYDRGDHPDTGGILDPDGDAIAALEPELALTSSWVDEADWAAVVPESASALVLGGFESMAAIGDNLHRIAEATGHPEPKAPTRRFEAEWRAAAEAVTADGVSALLLSPCGDQPYAYGAGTWLHEAFTAAGFEVVAAEAGVHFLPRSGDDDALAALVAERQPDVVFSFTNDAAAACPVVAGLVDVRVATLPGSLFLHPAPVIIDGLKHLDAERTQWQPASP